MLKTSGGTNSLNGLQANFIQVNYSGGAVTVATTTNGNNVPVNYTLRGIFAASFASGDTLSAVAYADGTVNVYKTSGATTTEIGSVTIPGAGFWTGTGRIGIQLPGGARIDNFAGGTVP